MALGDNVLVGVGSGDNVEVEVGIGFIVDEGEGDVVGVY
jgi:hypothetical protein